MDVYIYIFIHQLTRQLDQLVHDPDVNKSLVSGCDPCDPALRLTPQSMGPLQSRCWISASQLVDVIYPLVN